MISPKHIMIVAGEASGDLHAAHLVEELKHLDPSLTFSGLGGPRMQTAGVELYQDLTQFAVIGFSEVLKHFSEFKNAFHLFLSKAQEIRPAAVILVDYPGFNLRLVQKLKKSGAAPDFFQFFKKSGAAPDFSPKIIYYISPQVWAWKQNRVEIIKRCVDKMLVVFKFEKDFYSRLGMPSEFVGHPLVDTVKAETTRKIFLESLNFDEHKLTIGLLPGSRQKEIERHLPLMLKAADLLHKELPRVQLVIVKADNLKKSLLEKYSHGSSFEVKIIEDQTYEAIHACDACLVASGTATLETAILGSPMVIVYKISPLSWLLAKWLIKIPCIGLVNIVAGKRIVPECVQFRAKPRIIAEELKNILLNERKNKEIKEELRQVKESLGEGGASRRAAEAVLETLK